MYGIPSGSVTLWEDFLRDNVTNLTETVGSAAVQDVISRHGGWWRQSMDGNDADDALTAAEVAWEVDEGQPLTFETRVQLDIVTGASVFQGMSDANTEGSGASPYAAESGTHAAVATDAFGFLLDESASGTMDLTWQAVGVQNTTRNTEDPLTDAADLAAGVIQVLRMVATTADDGTVRYYIGTANEYGGGKLVETKTSWFRSEIVYCPILATEDRAVDCDLDTDYIYVSAPR